MNVLLAGLLVGGSYACVGMAVVLLHRLTGVVNFALLATSAGGVFTMLALIDLGAPALLAAVGGIFVGAFLATIQGVVDLRWFSDRGPTERSALTIPVLLGVLAGLQRIVGNRPRAVPDLLNNKGFQVVGVRITLTTVVMLVTVVGVAALATWVLRTRRTGIQLRAAATRPHTARLLGVDVTRIRVGVWSFVGALSTFTLILLAPTRTASVSVFALLIVPALGVALLANLSSLTGAVTAGFALGLVTTTAGASSTLAPFVEALPFVAIIAVLVWTQRGVRYADAR